MATDQPLEVALIGAGNRASTTYGAILPHLQEWVRVVAVCDPVVEHSEQLAARLGARSFHSIQDLVAAELVEAALVVTPIPSHHSISAFLSVHGIHHEVETAMADTLEQARDMVARAAAGGVETATRVWLRETIAWDAAAGFRAGFAAAPPEGAGGLQFQQFQQRRQD